MFACRGNGEPIAGTRFENPTSVLGPGWWDLREMLKPYMTSLGVLNCPSLKTAPLTDPGNTRAACYYAYDLFGGRGEVRGGAAPYATIPDRYPDFGLLKGVPENMDKLTVNPSLMPLTQDRLYYDSNTSGLTPQTFVYNHGTGPVIHNAGPGRPAGTDLTNPSHAYRSATQSNKVAGSNIAFYDGHARWYSLGEMDVVGGWHPAASGIMNISKLPTRTSSPVSLAWPMPPGVGGR
jgi:prepilin-type processing-associated H-X9-DG protein